MKVRWSGNACSVSWRRNTFQVGTSQMSFRCYRARFSPYDRVEPTGKHSLLNIALRLWDRGLGSRGIKEERITFKRHT